MKCLGFLSIVSFSIFLNFGKLLKKVIIEVIVAINILLLSQCSRRKKTIKLMIRNYLKVSKKFC